MLPSGVYGVAEFLHVLCVITLPRYCHNNRPYLVNSGLIWHHILPTVKVLTAVHACACVCRQREREREREVD